MPENDNRRPASIPMSRRELGTEVSRFFGQAGAPLAALVISGIYHTAMLGLSAKHWLDTFVPLLGGILGAVCLFTYRLSVIEYRAKGVLSALAVFSGLIPYAALLFLFGYCGVFTLWSLFGGFGISRFIYGMFFTLVGWRGLNGLWQMSELSKAVSLGQIDILDER